MTYRNRPVLQEDPRQDILFRHKQKASRPAVLAAGRLLYADKALEPESGGNVSAVRLALPALLEAWLFRACPAEQIEPLPQIAFSLFGVRERQDPAGFH